MVLGLFAVRVAAAEQLVFCSLAEEAVTSSLLPLLLSLWEIGITVSLVILELGELLQGFKRCLKKKMFLTRKRV